MGKGPKVWGEIKYLKSLTFYKRSQDMGKGPKIWGRFSALGPKIEVVMFGPLGIFLERAFLVGGDGGERKKRGY
jgi:hypothetical protein